MSGCCGPKSSPAPSVPTAGSNVPTSAGGSSSPATSQPASGATTPTPAPPPLRYDSYEDTSGSGTPASPTFDDPRRTQATGPLPPDPISPDGYDAGGSAPLDRPTPGGSAGTTGAGNPAASTGGAAPAGPAGWNDQWEARFTRDQLAPADIAFLRTAGYTSEELESLATELESQPLLDPNSPGGVPAADGSGAGSTQPVTNGPVDPATGEPLPGDPSTGGAGGANAWSPQWESKFSELLAKSGMSATDIEQQLSQVRSTPLSEDQLQQVYDQLVGQVGAWSSDWEKKFTKLFEKADLPKEQITEAITAMSQAGMSQVELEKAFTDASKQIEASKPGWSDDWEDKFKTLDIPEDMLKSLKDSKGSEENIKGIYETLLKAKMEFKDNGRLKKLEDADASADEKWGMMIEQDPKGGIKVRDVSDHDFDKAVEGIHSQHVPAWKRVVSIGLNLIPGVGTLQYLTGKDWVTGEKIDRSNPLNIGMAVLSAIPAIGYIKGGIQAVRGASMLGGALRAGAAGTEAAVAGGAAVNAIGKVAGESGHIATAMKAIVGGGTAVEAAGISGKAATSLMRFGAEGLSMGDKFKKAIDVVKMVTPGINRFGAGKELYQLGRGYFQLTKFAGTFASQLGNLDKLGVEGQKLMKALPNLSKLDEASLVSKLGGLKDAGKEGTRAFKETARQLDQIKRIREVTGLSPSQIRGVTQHVVPALEGQGTLFKQTGAMWRFNPTANQATATLESAGSSGGGMISRARNFVSRGGATEAGAATAGADTVRLGRGIGGGAFSGYGSTMGRADFANVASALTGERIGQIGTQLGVGSGGRFRALAQIRRAILPGSEQAVMADAAAMGRSGSTAQVLLSGAGRGINKNLIAPSLGLLGVGLVSGQTGKAIQPMWDYYKEKDRYAAEEQQQQVAADQRYEETSADLDAAWAQYQQEQAAGGQTTGAAAPVDAGAPVDASMAPAG